jgi:hypothetical protein
MNLREATPIALYGMVPANPISHYNYIDKYTFTLRELGEHLGMNTKTYQRDIAELNN